MSGFVADASATLTWCFAEEGKAAAAAGVVLLEAEAPERNGPTFTIFPNALILAVQFGSAIVIEHC